MVNWKIVGKYKNETLVQFLRNQTDGTECNITKQAKQLLSKYGFINEVGIWEDSLRYAIDLYSLESNIGIELCWASYNPKKLNYRFKKYKKFCKKIICVLLRDSSHPRLDKNYTRVPNRIMGAIVVILDMANTEKSSLWDYL